MVKALTFFTGLALAVGTLSLVASPTAEAPVTATPSTPVSDSASSPSGYSSPTGADPIVLRDFSVGEHNWLPGHRGVDLASADSAPVLAAGDGTVVFAGRLNNRSLVSIEHEGGLRTTYEPVSPVVSAGDHVRIGEVIGSLDAGHCLAGACLHWGAKRGDDDYINPMSLLAGPIRLVK